MPQPLREVLGTDTPTFSFEFSPPRDDAAERTLWQAIRELEGLRPSFVSVTYGAGGSTRDRTVRITEAIARETTLDPVGHLTCVAQSRDELRRVIGQYAAAGVGNVLALRGDMPGGPGAAWEPHPGGLDHAVELVEMLRALGRFCIGVAAFPDKHPGSATVDDDARVLAAKAEAGAEFAVTQFFFRAEDYFALVERAREHGCTIPVLPGIMPITNLSQVTRFAELSGADVPAEVVARVRAVGDDPAAVREVGTQIATELCQELLSGGAPGLHFYTLNRSRATRRIWSDLALSDVALSGR